MNNITIAEGDTRKILPMFPDLSIDLASFSPPYGSNVTFNIRKDFKAGGEFIPYALEIGRVCKLFAINLTQLLDNSELSVFIEEFIMVMRDNGIEVFDRWIYKKAVTRPTRGIRALSNYEFFILFKGKGVNVNDLQFANIFNKTDKKHYRQFKTCIDITRAKNRNLIASQNELSPYPVELPLQLINCYGYDGCSVLDPFVGSGTTYDACNLSDFDNIEFFGIDINSVLIEALNQKYNI